jgi:hypothetical protein
MGVIQPFGKVRISSMLARGLCTICSSLLKCLSTIITELSISVRSTLEFLVH